MMRYAAESGWSADVIACDPAYLRRRDDSLLELVPPGTRVFGVAPASYAPDEVARKLSAWWRAASQVVWPGRIQATTNPRRASLSRADAHSLIPTPQQLRRTYTAWSAYRHDRAWAEAATKLALKLINEAAGSEPYSLIVTSGPPHASHNVGRELSTISGLPHAMDLRDPWALVERLPEWMASPLWFALAERDERRAVASAALVVANTDPAAAALRARYPQHAERIIVVMNGYDEEDIPPVTRSDRFVIGYAGSVYLDRNPRMLFRASARVVRELGLTPQQFGIEFTGFAERFDNVPLTRIAEEEGIRGFVKVHPHIPRRELLARLAASAMLVILPQDSRLAIPSKAFEYMMFDAWILALADRDSATGQLFAQLNADLVQPDDLEGISAAIRRRYDAFARGERPRRLAVDGRFSRRAQTERMLDALVRRVRVGRGIEVSESLRNEKRSRASEPS